MGTRPKNLEEICQENTELKARLEEAEETLSAIRSGDVDAVIVGDRLYELESSSASSNKFRGEMLAQISEAVTATDSDGHLIYINEAAEHQYKVKANEMLGHREDAVFRVRWLRASDAADADNELRASDE
jgi:PAS domain-containing protein